MEIDLYTLFFYNHSIFLDFSVESIVCIFFAKKKGVNIKKWSVEINFRSKLSSFFFVIMTRMACQSSLRQFI